MPSRPAETSPLRSVLPVAVLASLVRLVIVWLGLPETHLISDDAYYYFVTARHMAAGAGPTFDGLAITNGFHPLWMLAVVPVFDVFPGDLWLPVRTALSLTVLFDLASGLLLHDLVRRHRGRMVAAVAATAWFVLPPTALLGLQGLEASLSTLMLLLLLRHLDRLEGAAFVSLRSATMTGVWLGLAGLARTDNLAAAGVAVVACTVLRNSPGRAGAVGLRLAVVGAATALVMAPWFIWNLVHFGSLVQVSGQVKLQVHELFGGLPWGWGDMGSATLTLLHMLFPTMLVSAKYLCGEQFDGGAFALPVALVSQALVLFLVALGARWRRDNGAWRAAVFVFPLATLLTHTVLFGFVWRSYATWYAHGCFALLIVLIAGSYGPQGQSAPGRGHRAGQFAAMTVGLLLLVQMAQYPLYLTRISLGARGPEKQFRASLDRLRDRMPEGARIGAFDAGALAYVAGHYDGFTVINLDGLVNNEIYRAYREDRYADWVIAHVDIVVQDLRRARLFCDPADVERLLRHYGQSAP